MGIHNGALYLIALGGLGYFLLFMLSIFSFAHNYTDQRLFYLLVMFAIIMQNGAVFSPSKLFFMIFTCFVLLSSNQIGNKLKI